MFDSPVERTSPVVLIELNEVPNPVLEAYAKQRSSYFADLLVQSDRYTTVTPDRIQLDPWIAWPTFHRGVNDEAHGMLRLGQDTSAADQAFPPIWRLLAEKGLSVGVYGSLFSSCETDLSPYAFFVPDVFSPHDRVKPADLQRFQSFNLAMTRASARNADDGVASGGGRAIAELALDRRLTFATMGRVAAQLVSEKLDKKKVSRRRNTQTELHADVFASLLARKPVDFAAFYTNNVAAAMHRFWSASVPGATLNRDRLSDEWVDTYSDEVFVALASVERLIARLKGGEFGPVTLIVASALGQEEIPAENYSSFLTVTDQRAFVEALVGREGVAFESVPTMVPDFSFRFESEADAAAMVARLSTFEIGGIRAVETLERMFEKELVGADPRMSYIQHHYASSGSFKHPVTFKQSDARTVHVSFQIDDYEGPELALVGNRTLPLPALGVGFISHDEGVNCTAQHCAEGALFVSHPGRSKAPQPMQKISILDVAPSLLSRFGCDVPGYMHGHSTIVL